MGIGRLFPVAFGIAVPTMMQVGPDEATVNFCKWPRKLAPSLPADCLPGLSAVDLYAIAAMLVCAGLVWFAWPYRHQGSKRARMMVGIFVVICGAATGVFGLSIIAAGDHRQQVASAAQTEAMMAQANSNQVSPELSDLLDKKETLKPFFIQWMKDHPMGNPPPNSPEAIEFFNSGLSKVGATWRVTSQNIDLLIGNVFIGLKATGNQTGISMKGAHGNVFEGAEINASGTAIELENSEKNQFRNLRINPSTPDKSK